MLNSGVRKLQNGKDTNNERETNNNNNNNHTGCTDYDKDKVSYNQDEFFSKVDFSV